MMPDQAANLSSTALVIMGVSGCGKSSVAEALSKRLEAVYVEADKLHSEEAKRSMQQGIPLTDQQRLPWLVRVGDALQYYKSSGDMPIVACSALTKRYRDMIRHASGDVQFVYLQIPIDIARQRIQAREQHFFPASLINSQFDTLEPPTEQETDCITIDATLPIAAIVASLVEKFISHN